MEVKLIYAQSMNGVIGNNGKLPWSHPEDMARFKRLTLGCPVIMGRKTWQSIPNCFRPLAGRENIVITSNKVFQANGATVVHSLDAALGLCVDSPVAWVIGGGNVYEQALPLASEVAMTLVMRHVTGDTYAPKLGKEWELCSMEFSASDPDGEGHRFYTYQRNKG